MRYINFLLFFIVGVAILLWIRSWEAVDEIPIGRSAIVESVNGNIVVIYYGGDKPVYVPNNSQLGYVRDRGQDGFRFLGVEYFKYHDGFSLKLRTYYGVHYGSIIILVGLIEIMALILAHRRSGRLRRKQHGYCAVCGYDLRASSERCPECGKQF